MGKLKEMAVSRVDGVDRPAIRKRFVLVKSEDAATEVEKDYKGAATAVVEAIAKEGISFSEETMSLLKALVETLELDVEFTAKAEDDDESDDADDADKDEDGDENDDADDADDADDDVEKNYSAEEAEALVEKALRAAGVDPKTITKRAADTTPLIVKKSRQPKSQDGGETVKKSMFANIVNGKPTEPYSGRR